MFQKKRRNQTRDQYVDVLFALTIGKSVEDIDQAVPETVTKEQFEALIEKLESGGFDLLAEKMKENEGMEIDIPKMIDTIKAGIKDKKSSDNKLTVRGLVDDLINGRPNGFFEYLEKQKNQRNTAQFKRRNKDEINRVIEYATDKPEIREKLESEYPAIFGFVEMTLTPPDNLSVLEYFRKLSQAKLTVNEKRYAVAPPSMEMPTAAKKIYYLGDNVFTVTPSFEYFMRQNSLNVEKITTKKPKTSLKLDMILNDINKNKLDKYGDLQIALEDIGDKLTAVELPKKLTQLKRLMDTDLEVYGTIDDAMSMVVREDRLKLPRDDVFVIAYPNKEEYDEDSDNFKNFANKYFDGDEDEAYDFVEDNTGKLDMIRDRNYKGDEIIIPERLKRIFEELTTLDEFDPKGSLEMSISDSENFFYAESLNDLKFANKNNIADYLETISIIQDVYLRVKSLKFANLKYIDKKMEYETLIELYEKEFKDVKDRFIDMIGERVQELSKTRDTLSQKIRPVIQEVFGE